MSALHGQAHGSSCQPTQSSDSSGIGNVSNEAEVGELLMGLGSDDLNDFDGLEAFESGVVNGSKLDHAAFDPPSMALNIGFATGAGKSLAPPSSLALQRARRFFDEDDANDNTDAAPHAPEQAQEHAAEPLNKRRRVSDSVDLSSKSFFTTGRGGAVAPPSRSAVERASRILAEGDDGDKQHQYTTPTRPADGAPSRHMFHSGLGEAAPSTSAAARARALAMFGEADPQMASIPPMLPPDVPPGPSSMFVTAAGSLTRELSAGARARALAVLGEVGSQARVPGTVREERLQPSEWTPIATQTSLLGPDTPSRTPLQTTTNTFANRLLPQHANFSTPISIKPPSSNPRLGSTGRTSSTHVRRAGQRPFVTPFKAPGRVRYASNLAPETRQPSTASDVHFSAKLHPSYEPIFNLQLPLKRQTWREAFLKPQYYSDAELQEMGLPNEIWRLNMSNAIFYQFIAEDGSRLSNATALDRLQRDGAHLASADWVDNHYPLTLWKLAGLVRAQPDLFDRIWNWGTLIEQLKYRYEREFGSAQRPIVRRIQEHDSSAAIPIILCISGILRPPAREETTEAPVRHALELTDGWYRIHAEIDECLARALAKGKLAVGRKLAICGAKLQSAADGEDALLALDKSYLVLSANSTALARWDAKLGRQQLPFIAKLSHLSNDGGVIALLDVVVEKMFPIAFVPSGKDNSSPPWGEEEESSRQEQWKERYESQSSRLQERMRDRLEKVEDLVAILGSHAEDVHHLVKTGAALDNPDQAFDDLLTSKDVMRSIRGLRPTQLVQLASYARGRMEQEVVEAQNEVMTELKAACPERSIRSFRLIRIRDAQVGDKPSTRLGMLTLWEAKSMPEGVIQQGRRYLVSNIMPGRSGDWSLSSKNRSGPTEIYLHTRRDSRWQPVV